MGRIKRAECIGDCFANHLRVAQGQPNVLVVFRFLIMVMTNQMFADLFARHIGREKRRPGFFGINDCVKALITHAQMEMFDGGRLDHVVVKFNVNRRSGPLIDRLETIHGRLCAGRPILDVIADIPIVGFDRLSVVIRESDVIAIDFNILNIRLVARLIIGFIFIGRHFPGFRHCGKRFIQRSVQRKRICGLPIARPIRKGSVLNLIVFKGRNLFAVVVIMLGFLHAFHNFLLLDFDAGEHGNRFQIGVLRGFQHIVHPAVGFAADVNEQVAGRNLGDIRCGRLVVVQVNAVIQQERQFNIIRMCAQNLAHPVVLRKGCADDAQFILRKCGSGHHGDQRQKRGKNLFHRIFTSNVVFGYDKKDICQQSQYPICASQASKNAQRGSRNKPIHIWRFGSDLR